MLRTHTCGEMTKKNNGETVTLCGWVHRRRDHGGVIFIDLRDRYGLTQVKFDPEKDKKAHSEAESLRSEWVIAVKGKVALRPGDMINPKMKTGEIEIEAGELSILNQSKTPPFELDEEKAKEANESVRLKYRFVDLRRNKLQEIMKKRDDVIRYIREYFHKNDFIEVQTPILANSSPEGARDFLVPSRLHPGKFFALPQAPQQFKQLLMVGGLDRYFQIAPCFRDEDPRADRHPGDFYQVDMEMSFVVQEDVWNMCEPLMIELTEKFSHKNVLNKKFPRIPYREAMEKYGSDKPDLRFGLEIRPITDAVKDCGFGVFADTVKAGGVVHALKVDGGAKFTRKEIDDLTDLAKSKGAKGLAYIQIKEDKLQSPIIKFLGEDLAREIIASVGAASGDIVFFGADKWRAVCDALGVVRNKCGEWLGLKDNSQAAWVWIVDWQMYEYSELEEGRIDFSHNPFSMPQGGLEALNTKDPLDILAYQYDLVCNGYEISSGAIRNHDPEIMYKAFEIAGYTKEQVDEKFGAMISAFEYGAPPHGGMAPGLDRLLMIFFDLDNIRDIYAFPKDGQCRDLMMNSPAEVDEKQLKELHVRIAKT
ncbi:aspartate--tRNA ligase [Candidatus Falkowbacteria bacterium RIFOXYB2_FULL_47_14]|uniref:Aspartate--tRNA(Asp/Asn) ligase n=1 Tax=Candidatus Falkowbacteria bacterium RIFOXYA2_FULL_47_19 TaxID=1797994 RepID=A0A1F5SI62_9BACT|nr:MAG: aspartate--tRNA ligase [Candidatus Falkowbacteria bacterium RIFOXYA2_FULL_47_19]OGF35433.1 MAG: aspartate--tRNA ligase [Candidatus Falkowbacteria bacterium RIFOXYC2_FULL_46_15]OGF42575.1 MAG: aspartate--tRNA ligase [Candidatus Falkowbacteria bacterium RIFOXYB2_FULL_47_14]